VTNALAVQRMALGAGEAADAPAVYVRALDLAVERLERQQVEDDVDGGDLPRAAAYRRVAGQVHARLQPLEARAPMLVEGDELAIHTAERDASRRPIARTSGQMVVMSRRLRLSRRQRPGSQ
jgi:hypothetical protein